MCVQARDRPQVSFLRYHDFVLSDRASHCLGTCTVGQAGWPANSRDMPVYFPNTGNDKLLFKNVLVTKLMLTQQEFH